MKLDLGDGITFFTRDEWAQGRSVVGTELESRAPTDIDTCVVHRTTGNHLGDTSTGGWLRNLYDFHVTQLGYADIAYELVVDAHGDVWECRPLSLWSAAQRGHNATCAAVAALGPERGDPIEQLPRQHVGLTKAYLLLSWAAGRPLTQRAHSDLVPHACPGPEITRWIHAGGLGQLPPKKKPDPRVAQALEMWNKGIVPMIPTPDPNTPPPPIYQAVIPAGGISAGVVARIRTVVPALIGVAVVFVQHRFGIVVHLDAAETSLAVVIVTGGYYDLVRRLEAWKPSLGWLLGYPSPPKYDKAA